MEIKNRIPKGTVLDVTVSDGKIYLICGKHRLDISGKVSNQEKGEIIHLGKALALVKSNEEISLITFVNFHNHSEYSILDGMSKVSDLAKKSSGISALTDHGNCYGTLQWQKAMQKENKKAVFGSEVYVETMAGEKQGNHLILLAMNEVGKKNLFLLSSNAFYNFHKKPHVSIKDLEEHNEGLICTSACLGGEIAVKIKDDYEGAKEVALWYKNIFHDNYYLEIQRHGARGEAEINQLILKLAKELNIKVVAANDSHYLNKDDAKYHEILLCINTGKKLSEPHFKFDGTGYWFKTDSEMVQDFWDIPEAITNTYEIAKKCNLEIETGKYYFPQFEIPEGYNNEEDYLLYLIDKGFKERFEGTPQYTDETYKKRLDYEKNIILSMGFTTYFLIVWEYVSWAKSHGILVGPGRGSAAGSLACYCLTITDLEPIKYGLLFERFLNPERVSMPDIDMDFEYSRRQEVIDHVKERYGEDRVCNIITFGTMAAKGAVKDAARVTSNYEMGDRISKMIPNTPGITLKSALEENPDFSLAYEGDPGVKEIVDTAMKLEGNKRQTSTHACGVVVAGGPVKNYLPTALVADSNNKNNRILVSQVTMTEVEELGLLKMDFLGLRTMTVIGYCMKDINQRLVSEGKVPMQYYREIPLNDPYVYREISKGKTYAVFQIESEGMRKFMSQLFGDVSDKIEEIEQKYSLKGFKEITGDGVDQAHYLQEMERFGEELFERMIAGVSLYRPGPMDYIPDYLKGIANPESIKYDTPELKPILQATYGVIVYQEQVMQVVQALAGFSMGAADTVRRAMGKKKQAILDEYKPYFLNGSGEAVDSHTGMKLNIIGCTGNGISQVTAEKIWDKMADFAKYAFNKSHAAVYAVLSIICAWIKTYYPEIYMCAMLNTYLDENNKLKAYISATKNAGIKILPPSINQSQEDFSLENDCIRFGLKGLKGLSSNIEEILKVRESGAFDNVSDFFDRTISFINKKGYEALIKAGALDESGYNRKTLMKNLDKLVSHAQGKLKDQVSGQLSLFDSLLEDVVDIEETEEFSKQEKLDFEKEFVSLYISEHPLDEYREIAKKLDCSEIGLIDDDSYGETTLLGLITDITVKYTKKDNKPMSVFKIEDQSSEIKCVVFPKEYESISPMLKKGNKVVVKGSINNDSDFGIQILTSSVMNVDNIVEDKISVIYVHLKEVNELELLKERFKNNAGDIPVKAQIGKKLYFVATTVASASVFMELQNTYGSSNVIMR